MIFLTVQGDDFLTFPANGISIKNVKQISVILKELINTQFNRVPNLKIQLRLVSNDAPLRQRLLEFEQLDPMVR